MSPLFPFLGPVLAVDSASHRHTRGQEALPCPLPKSPAEGNMPQEAEDDSAAFPLATPPRTPPLQQAPPPRSTPSPTEGPPSCVMGHPPTPHLQPGHICTVIHEGEELRSQHFPHLLYVLQQSQLLEGLVHLWEVGLKAWPTCSCPSTPLSTPAHLSCLHFAPSCASERWHTLVPLPATWHTPISSKPCFHDPSQKASPWPGRPPLGLREGPWTPTALTLAMSCRVNGVSGANSSFPRTSGFRRLQSRRDIGWVSRAPISSVQAGPGGGDMP